MKIYRRGYKAFCGISQINMEKLNFSWEKQVGCFQVKSRGIKDFSTKSQHDYTLSFSLEEFSSMLNAIAFAAMQSPQDFEVALLPCLKPLLQLQMVAAGAYATKEILK